MTRTISFTLEEAWETCRDLYEGLASRQRQALAADLEAELLFCLLGGYGISYELNRSAAEIVAQMHPFDRAHDQHLLRQAVEALLRGENFEPRRADGRLRRYRFPSRKTELIVAARRWLHEQPPLADLLRSMPNERQRRAHLCSCPGVGLKTASWLLRNLGLARDIAVLDVHLLRALATAGRLAKGTRLPKDYEAAEAAFLNWCNELDADPGAFDLFVWEWQRGALVA